MAQSRQSRGDNLALSFQEMLTAVVRLRFNRQNASNAEAFRAHMKEAMKTAMQDARAKGYQDSDIQAAAFAVVAFVDETVLNLRNPAFANWSRLPLQEELFGGHLAGEAFFQALQQLLGRRDGADVGDLLEVYYLCLLLGYRGRYGLGAQAEVHAVMDSVRDKIRRVRGAYGPLAPGAKIPDDAPPPLRTDPWVKRLAFTAAGIALLAVVLFGVYSFALHAGSNEFKAAVARARV